MDICIRVGRRIRYLRTRKGIPQVVLADRAEVTRPNLSRIENGKIEPGLRTLERISKALDVTLVELVGPGS